MRKLHIVRRILFAGSLVLLLLLAGFQSILITFSESDVLKQATSQSTRAQRIAKNALVLAYRPDSERPQAISELQNTLPAWEAQQARMQDYRNTELHTLVVQSQPDFIAIDTAARKLLAHPTAHADIVQVVIIIQSERNYSLLMSQAATLLQQRIEAFNLYLVLFEEGIAALLFMLKATQFIITEKERRKAQEKATQLQETIKELQEALAKQAEGGNHEQ